MSEPVIETTPTTKPVNTWWTYIINLCTVNKTSSQIQVEEPLINESNNPVADVLPEQIFEPVDNSTIDMKSEEKVEQEKVEQEKIDEPVEEEPVEEEPVDNKQEDVIAGPKNEDEDVDISNESIETRESPDQYEETKEESI